MIPEARAPLDNDLPSRKEQLDVSKIFLAYIACFGDVVQTADVANCRIADVLYLSKSELWDKKLSESQTARGPTPEKAKERGREINRMANYIQAIRLRGLIDKTLQWVYENEENITKFASEINKQGNRVFSTKPILDLAKSAETVQLMTYRALGDQLPKEDSNPLLNFSNIKGLHLTVIEQMKDSGQIPEGALKQAEKANATDVTESIGYLDVNKALE